MDDSVKNLLHLYEKRIEIANKYHETHFGRSLCKGEEIYLASCLHKISKYYNNMHKLAMQSPTPIEGQGPNYYGAMKRVSLNLANFLYAGEVTYNKDNFMLTELKDNFYMNYSGLIFEEIKDKIEAIVDERL